MVPHCIVILPDTNGMQLLLCYDSTGALIRLSYPGFDFPPHR